MVEDRPIEQCDVIQKNVWGYRIKEREFRSAPDVVRLIVRAAAKDSNLLVNIGPDASGRLPAKAVEVMRDVGVWMRENGYAVYGSRGGGFSKDGGTAYTRKHGVTYAISWTDGTNSMPRVSTVKN
ncbi:MAG: alpha-L-fucosidase [Kiritimatiellae bacterium]|nr:alpha-L-fucosidase [Kiritimatiellia bacterium]